MWGRVKGKPRGTDLSVRDSHKKPRYRCDCVFRKPLGSISNAPLHSQAKPELQYDNPKGEKGSKSQMPLLVSVENELQSRADTSKFHLCPIGHHRLGGSSKREPLFTVDLPCLPFKTPKKKVAVLGQQDPSYTETNSGPLQLGVYQNEEGALFGWLRNRYKSRAVKQSWAALTWVDTQIDATQTPKGSSPPNNSANQLLCCADHQFVSHRIHLRSFD